ncbi:MAG TPA: fluoride efflux transporter CrcB [Acidimicrobiales bacterium]|nr:fluoride efflux transporter CrcB [Acidimicrobiales bacterium]
MTPVDVIGVMGAGAVGAPARFLVDAWMGDRTVGPFPWGTFVVNVSGSFVLGVLTGLVLYHGFPQTPKVIVGTGFCGSYTTFSSFSFETVRLLEEGAHLEAAANVAGNLVACTLGAGAALALVGVL